MWVLEELVFTFNVISDNCARILELGNLIVLLMQNRGIWGKKRDVKNGGKDIRADRQMQS